METISISAYLNSTNNDVSFKQAAHSLAIEVDTESPDPNRDREDKTSRLQHVTWDAPHQPCWREKDAGG